MAKRQDTCPCGSGRKTRQCCGAKGHGRSPHHRDEQLVVEMLRYARSRWGVEWFEQATATYFEEALPEPGELDPQLFLPWLVHHWSVEGRPVREWYLEERGARLVAEERAWLEAQREVVITVWRILETQPGIGVRVRHLLGPEERFVQERLGSYQLHPGDAVLGRVVTFEQSTVFCGLYPFPLPPLETGELVRAVRRELRVRGVRAIPPEKLAAEDTAVGLILLWRDQVAYLDHLARWALLEELLAPEDWSGA